MNLTQYSLRESKQKIRKSILKLRDKQPADLIKQKSGEILKNLISTDFYKKAKVVLLYCGKEKEVQTKALIKIALQEKRVILPITNVKKRILEISEIKNFENELYIGAFKILEPKKEYLRPIPLNEIDLIVVPGVAFDYKGNRLGYGYAYYDKLLKQVEMQVPLIGLAFEFQLQDSIPHSQYDIPIDYIITEKQIIKCS